MPNITNVVTPVFQFHKGTIKTSTLVDETGAVFVISIP